MQTYNFALQESFLMPVLDNGHAKVMHLSFPKGKVLERHKAPVDILIFLLSGRIDFQYGEEAVQLEQGQMVSLEKNVEHSLTALEDSVVALVLTPSPSSLKPKTAEPTAHAKPLPMSSPNAAVSPQLQSFVEEHADLLRTLHRAQQEQSRASYQEAGDMVRDELNKHFRYEEEILFPLLGKYIGTSAGPIAVMLGEHKIIREQYNRLEKVLDATSEVTDEIRQSFQTLADFLSAHITKEDHVLFPMASSVMSQDDQNEVAHRVELEKQKEA